jgi:hypothetical protein
MASGPVAILLAGRDESPYCRKLMNGPHRTPSNDARCITGVIVICAVFAALLALIAGSGEGLTIHLETVQDSTVVIAAHDLSIVPAAAR